MKRETRATETAKRILLIDGENSVGLVLRRVLPEYEIRQESSGVAGLAAASFWPPDLMLIDLGLRDLQAESLAELVRLDRSLGRTPIIFLSATLSAREEDQPVMVRQCPTFGKPFNVAVLRWYVESEIARHQSSAVHV